MPPNIESTARDVLRLYPVKRAALFGSVAREEIKDHSGIDMLVELLPDALGILFFGLHADLERAFGRHVDLMTYEALDTETKPRFKESVLRDAKVIYEYEREN